MRRTMAVGDDRFVGRGRFFGMMVGALLFGLLVVARSAHADTTFTINSTADTGDATPDGTCDTCTLREAIQEANFISGGDTPARPSSPATAATA
jgi:CSLREA domain-containing protein